MLKKLLETGKILPMGKIPMYDIATASSAFYVGYAHAKGIDPGAMVHTTYGFPLAAVALSSTATVGFQAIASYLGKHAEDDFAKLVCLLIAEEGITPKSVVKDAAVTGTRYGLESMVGYMAGQFAGQLF